jgi:hypothetical protein
MTKTEAKAISGSLSNPAKMPGLSYGTPAEECQMGAKLAKLPGTACYICYAKKGNYERYKKTIKPAQYKRFESINNPRWVEAMVVQIADGCRDVPYFRWHDSGDLQSVEHLRKIVSIAVLLPEVHFWLPTREYDMVREYLASGGQIPKNLVIRMSAHKIDGPAPDIAGLPASTIYTTTVPAGATECKARYQKNECRDCRACWDPAVKHVSYHQH